MWKRFYMRFCDLFVGYYREKECVLCNTTQIVYKKEKRY